eukprot:UN01948
MPQKHFRILQNSAKQSECALSACVCITKHLPKVSSYIIPGRSKTDKICRSSLFFYHIFRGARCLYVCRGNVSKYSRIQ